MYFDNLEIERFILDAIRRNYRTENFLDVEEMFQLVKELWPTVSEKRFKKIFSRCLFQMQSR